MLGVLASDGKVMPPLWIDRGSKVDSKVYIEQLKKVKVWLDDNYGDHTPWVFMQDGAPSHTSQDTQDWLKESFGADKFWAWYMWPPSSPDCNPLDFNVWGYVESKACANSHPNITALQKSVDKYWMELLTEGHVRKTCDSAWKRIRRMIQAKGNTFELEMKKEKKQPTSASNATGSGVALNAELAVNRCNYPIDC